MRAQLSASLLPLDIGLELASEQCWLSVVVYDDVIEEGLSNPVGSFLRAHEDDINDLVMHA
jgi:hypothetical protein